MSLPLLNVTGIKEDMHMFDKKVLDCFLKDQLRLFPEKVAETPEEAAEFLEEVFAVVVNGKKEVLEYFEEEGIDMDPETIFDAEEVFDIGDGRYLIVEA